jgi:hypothetical protein
MVSDLKHTTQTRRTIDVHNPLARTDIRLKQSRLLWNCHSVAEIWAGLCGQFDGASKFPDLRRSHEISASRMCRGRSCMYVPGAGWRTGFRRGGGAHLWGICQWAASLCRGPAPRRAVRPDHGQCAGSGFAAAQQADAARRGLLRARRQPARARCESPSTHAAAVSYPTQPSL